MPLKKNPSSLMRRTPSDPQSTESILVTFFFFLPSSASTIITTETQHPPSTPYPSLMLFFVIGRYNLVLLLRRRGSAGYLDLLDLRWQLFQSTLMKYLVTDPSPGSMTLVIGDLSTGWRCVLISADRVCPP
jgi:hypothetical protein